MRWKATLYTFFSNSFQIVAPFIFMWYLHYHWVSLVAQMVKNLPVMQETQAWSLGQEDPLEKEMATQFNILAWKIPQTEKPGKLQSTESQRVGHDWATNTFTFHYHKLNSHIIYGSVWGYLIFRVALSINIGWMNVLSNSSLASTNFYILYIP